MADPIITYQNYGVPSHIVNLEDKQIVFPEDDDSDIIIVNEDYNRNSIEQNTVQNLKELDDIESTTTVRFHEAPDANEYVWMTTEWSPCNAPCGQVGHEVRGAVCQHKTHNSTTTVETEECISRGAKPPSVLRECHTGECATWRTAPWSPVRCLASGAAVSRRRVECTSENGTVLSDGSCDSSSRPEKIRREETRCKPSWTVGAWSRCVGQCGGRGRQHRLLRCVWAAGGARAHRARQAGAGAACEGMRRPAVSRACAVHTCTTRDGVCRDSSRFCENVRAMNMCALRPYKEQCCKTCQH
ncbi:unnamed protein product [Diatraea saccharalis]|uniref:PLAC domain-containing protein n=1 Tax=Diatraea saccharalis TaxID=40085 RepID=A0A9N9WH30_9NEOP|nr:unnamed protein product [Diatraea saccharalis]